MKLIFCSSEPTPPPFPWLRALAYFTIFCFICFWHWILSVFKLYHLTNKICSYFEGDDYDEDRDCEKNEGETKTEGHKKDNGVEKEEDDDELDAFMAEINKQAQKEVNESRQKVLFL